MLGQLVPCGGGRPIPLFQPKLLVGRQSFCDIPLGFPTVSSRHCELELLEGYWYVRDLGSKNGTRVNGKPCDSQRLLPNDILAVAGYRYVVTYTPPPGASPPETAEPVRAEPDSLGSAAEPSRAVEKAAPRSTPEGAFGKLPCGQLVPCGGGDPIPLRQPKMVVGRHEACDVFIPVATISARHCQLEWTDQGWWVRDLGSRNGIRVDGVRCEEKLLTPGSILALAGQRYEVVYTSQEAGSPRRVQARLFAQSLLEAAGLVHWRPERAVVGRKQSTENMRQRLDLDDPARS